MPTNASLNAINATTMRANSLGRRFSNITRSCSSITDTTLLLECRSMPAYSFIPGSSFKVVRHDYSTHDSTLRLRSRLDDYQAYTYISKDTTRSRNRFHQLPVFHWIYAIGPLDTAAN